MTSYLTISEDAFIERFQPLPNVLNDGASFDFGKGGCLYETYGAELAHVIYQSAGHLWTVVEGDDGLMIASGFHFVNRLGYIITAKPHDAHGHIDVMLDWGRA